MKITDANVQSSFLYREIKKSERLEFRGQKGKNQNIISMLRAVAHLKGTNKNSKVSSIFVDKKSENYN